MSGEPENLVLELLRGLRSDVQSMRGEMHAEFSDVKQRMTTLERGMAGVKRDSGDLYEDHARQQAAIDRLNERIERIERRLDLRENA